MSVTFYATVDAESIRPYMPAVPVMLPATSFARKGFRTPRLPEHVTERAADCGGFTATFRWGDYRFTPDEYVAWLRTWRPTWAATFDYCCEDEITSGHPGAVQDRQDRTTEQAWRFWLTYRDEPWAWVPTVQGWTVDDYRRHARDLQPLVRVMARHYGESPAWRVGVGTLCRRASEGTIRDVVLAAREELPGVPLHLWGVKLTLFQSAGGPPPGVVSMDSAAWNGRFGRDIERSRHSALTQRQYAFGESLPRYVRKVKAALGQTRTLPLLSTGVA